MKNMRRSLMRCSPKKLQKTRFPVFKMMGGSFLLAALAFAILRDWPYPETGNWAYWVLIDVLTGTTLFAFGMMRGERWS